jgi:hypothetical protein
VSSTSGIVGLAVGGAVFLALLAAVFYYFYSKGGAHQEETQKSMLAWISSVGGELTINLRSRNNGDGPAIGQYKGDVEHVPTKDNPMGNYLFGADDPKRPAACYYPTVKNDVRTLLDDTVPTGNFRSRAADPQYQRNLAARQFVTMPVSTMSGSAQTDFAEFCYGKKFAPMCHDDPSVCNPNARGVQREAFGGLRGGGIRR